MTTRKRILPKLRTLVARPSTSKSSPTVTRPAKPAIPVLVATDASHAAGAAVKFARGMADKGLWAPEALTVIEHLPIAVAEVALPPVPAFSEPEISQGVVSAVKRQLRRFGGATWRLSVQFGSAAHSIVTQARQQGAELIVLGLGRHGKLARLLGAETVTRVCRLSDTPVLAIDTNASPIIWTALVAVDFGESSVRAARAALSLLHDGGHLHLVHVRWALDGQTLHDPAWERTYELGVEHALARLERELATEGIKITSEMRTGNVVETLLKAAKTIDADVIAAGSHSQTVMDRLLMGSTPAQLLRAAKCSVLVAPPESTQDA